MKSPMAVVIDDDPGVRGVLLGVFASAGFRATSAENGVDGVSVVREQHPLITTVSATIPGIDGFETVRRLRAISDTYIVLVSPHDDEADAVLGLSIGADDYVTTPLRPREFRARVEAVLRRARGRGSRGGGMPAGEAAASVWQHRSFQHRDLTVDAATRVVRRGGSEVVLTRTEFDLLRTLLESGRRVRSKADLAMVARGDEPVSAIVSQLDKRAIEAHIANLRRKLGDSATEPRYVETIRGLGYRLSTDDTAAAD